MAMLLADRCGDAFDLYWIAHRHRQRYQARWSPAGTGHGLNGHCPDRLQPHRSDAAPVADRVRQPPGLRIGTDEDEHTAAVQAPDVAGDRFGKSIAVSSLSPCTARTSLCNST
jgi:hypothetical protein